MQKMQTIFLNSAAEATRAKSAGLGWLSWRFVQDGQGYGIGRWEGDEFIPLPFEDGKGWRLDILIPSSSEQ